MSPSSLISSKFLNLLFLILLSLFIYSCTSSRTTKTTTTKKIPAAPVVRILLNEPSGTLELKLQEDITLFAENRETGKFRKGDVLKFVERDGLSFRSGRSFVKAKTFLLKSNKNFTYSDKVLTGDIKVISSGKNVYLINTISIEEYLKGVIPSEMPLGTGNEYYEALKGFAICARTFTLQRISSGGNLYDVRTDVRDQVYGGLGRGRDISNRVVDDTRGMVLTYNNEPATVFYSSTCGGKTEDVENVFGSSKYPYLTSVTDGHPAYCNASPRWQWEERMSGDRIIALLKRGGKLDNSTYSLAGMNINSRFRSGKINELEIMVTGSKGRQSVKLYGNNIRFILLSGRNQTLNSNQFEIVKNGREYILKGKGWGHGVGLCQWGALIQSTKGIAYNKILSHYFPGTRISRYYD